MPLWRKWCLRKGWVDEPGHRKIHQQPIALAGGLAVMTGLLLPALVAALVLLCEAGPNRASIASGQTGVAGNTHPRLKPFSSEIAAPLLYGLERRATELGAIFLGALGMLAIGWTDDQRELRPGAKFIAQFLVAALVSVSGARITLFVHNAAFHYTVTILWILTLINAFNFMDNMNGLCAGLGAIGAVYFAAISASEGQYLVALIAFLIVGALLGFLPYNFPSARAFLGDSGSHLVGYLLAVLAILPHFYSRYHPRPLAVLIPLLVLAVPLADLVCVVFIRWRLGKPFYIGDNNHLSHRLVRKGLSRTDSVLLIWLLAVLTGGLACFL
jgi:UDP-GlcNAc:undecaprenyl-phosphate GlcNAc-1-phosphate transferase